MNVIGRVMLENWYFELIHEGGPVSLCFARTAVLGSRAGAFTVRSRHLDHVGRFAASELAVEQDGKRVRFGPGSITEEEDGCRVIYRAQGLELDLAFRSNNAPYLPNRNGVLYEKSALFGDELFRWIAPLPVAAVTGTVNGAPVATLGYHDFLETNLPPHRFPFQAIHKGRFYADEQSIVTFLDLRFRDDLKRPPETFAVYAHLDREPIESERTLLVRDEVKGDMVVVGTAVMSFHGRELEFLFRNTHTVYQATAPDVLPFASKLTRDLFRSLAAKVQVAQFVSGTPSGDHVIHGMHEIITSGGSSHSD
jgi:hypothetical protein